MRNYYISNADNHNCKHCCKLNNFYGFKEIDNKIIVKTDQLEGKYRRISPSSDLEIIYCDIVAHEDVNLVGYPQDNCFEFSIIISEKCRLMYKNNVFNINSNEGMFRQASEKEVTVLEKESLFKGVTIRLYKEYLYSLLELYPNVKVLIDNNLNYKKHLLSSDEKLCIKQIILTPESMEFKEAYIKSKVTELLILSFESITNIPDFKKIYKEIDIKALYLAKEIIDHNFVKPPTIPQLSTMVNLNEYKLKKGFKNVNGITIHEYVIKKRMEKAKLLLISTDLTIDKIAFKIGYKDATHFASQFRKTYSIYPSELKF